MTDKFNYSDIDDDNIDMAKEIISESKKLEIPNPPSLEELLTEENSKKSKFVFFKKYGSFMGVAACFTVLVSSIVFTQNMNNKKSPLSMVTKKSEYHVAKNYDEIYSVLNDTKFNSEVKNNYVSKNIFTEDSAVENSLGAEKIEEKSDSDSSNTKSKSDNSGDYSKTNVQTEDVDEGDIVKTDGKYIYTLTNSHHSSRTYKNYSYRGKKEINITEAGSGNPKTISYINLPIDSKKTVSEIYVYKNRLVAICKSLGYVSVQYDEDDSSLSDSKLSIYTYDLSNIYKPKLIKINTQQGKLVSTRLKDNYLYSITYLNTGDNIDKNSIPKINSKTQSYKNIAIPNNVEAKGFTVITVIDLNNAKDFHRNISIMGSSDQIYMSQDNLYIFNNYTKHIDKGSYKSSKKFSDYIFKKRRTNSIENDTAYLEDLAKYAHINPEDIQVNKKEVSMDLVSKLSITKYRYKDGDLSFVSNKEIEGSANDNLFFDEKDGYLRCVVEKNIRHITGYKYQYYNSKKELSSRVLINSSDSDVTTSSAIVLDKSLKKVASIDGLGEGENIYSARFLGDYGYFVTFKQTDPLFSIDYTDIRHPKLLSELKMPGFSSYLHFYGKDRLLGVGMQNDEESFGSNLKLEMYDIKNGDAKQLAKIFVNDNSDTYITSEALNDYHSILVDSKKNIIGIPYSEYENKMRVFYNLYTYQNDKFVLKKKIELNSDSSFSNYRGLYIGDYLYIVSSDSGIYTVNLKDKSENSYNYMSFN